MYITVVIWERWYYNQYDGIFVSFELSAPRRPQHIKVTRKKVLREEYEHWELVHNGWVG